MVMCMVLYDDIFECGFSHIFTSKGKGIVVLNCASLLIFSTKKFVKDVDYSSIQAPLSIYLTSFIHFIISFRRKKP